MQRWIKLPDGRFIDANRVVVVGRPQSFAQYEDGSEDMGTAFSVQIGIDYSRENQITVVGTREEVLTAMRNLLGASTGNAAETTPASTALINKLTNACNDDTAPRWRGWRSSSIKVNVGKQMPMPIACKLIGSTDHGTCACAIAADKIRFKTLAPSINVYPMPIVRVAVVRPAIRPDKNDPSIRPPIAGPNSQMKSASPRRNRFNTNAGAETM